MSTGASRRTERLMCLVFVLKARGRRGITRAELRRAIADYAECTSDQSFERMLERDKRDLRDAGVAIEVLQRDAWHEDEHAYVLAQHALASMPRFTTDELAMLGLAAEAWEQTTWESLASDALRKVEVFGADFVIDPQPRVTLRTDEHLPVIRAAIRANCALHFAYRRPGDSNPGVREVEPWGLVHREGGWYLVGFDRHRNAPRVFRTSRIVGEMVSGTERSVPVQPDWSQLLDTYFSNLQPLRVRMLIAPNHGWAWRGSGRVVGQCSVAQLPYDEVEVELVEHDGLVGELAASAPHVLVVEPVDLRSRIVEHLQAVPND